MRRLRQAFYGFAIAALSCAIPLLAQSGAANGEWRSYGGDEGSTRYSPLDQINRENVKDAEDRLDLEVRQLRPRGIQERVDAAHGERHSVFHRRRPAGGRRRRCRKRRDALGLENGRGRAPSAGAAKEFRPRRGVLGGRSGRTHRRHHAGIPHRRAERAGPASRSRVSARTGLWISSRSIDTREDLTGRIGNTSPAVIARNTIVVGPALLVGARVSKENVKADIMAFDVRTGRRKWVVSHDSAKGRGRLRNVAERLRRIHGERRNVGTVLRRPGTGLCLSPD